MQNENDKNKQLVQPKQLLKTGEEVTLEQLESLCYNYAGRPRGCHDFYSAGDGEDILF